MLTFRDRYPPPWRAEQMQGGYKVIASNGIVLVYIYAEDNWATTKSVKMSWSEARALAIAISKMAETERCSRGKRLGPA